MEKIVILFIITLVVSIFCAGYFIAIQKIENDKKKRIEMFIKRNVSKVDNRDLRSEIQKKRLNTKLKALNEEKRLSKSRIGIISAKIQQAGLEMSITKFWIIVTMFGLAGATICTLGKFPRYTIPISFILLTFVIPNMVLNIMAKKRARMFLKQFITALDIMTRGLQSGLPTGECFRIIAREIEDPCGVIFKKMIDETNAGLSLVETLERAYKRMPLQEFMFFCTVLTIQEQTGGSLAEILSKISDLLRERAQLKEKIKALSGEARAQSMVIGALPVFVGGALALLNYDYIALLWQTRVGNMFLGGAIVMMFLGVFIMTRLGKIDMR